MTTLPNEPMSYEDSVALTSMTDTHNDMTKLLNAFITEEIRNPKLKVMLTIIIGNILMHAEEKYPRIITDIAMFITTEKIAQKLKMGDPKKDS